MMETLGMRCLIKWKQSGVSSYPSAQSMSGFVSVANSMGGSRALALTVDHLHGNGHRLVSLFIRELIRLRTHLCRDLCTWANLAHFISFAFFGHFGNFG